jgi:hypothetical protein
MSLRAKKNEAAAIQADRLQMESWIRFPFGYGYPLFGG